jgi:hypothetical protein
MLSAHQVLPISARNTATYNRNKRTPKCQFHVLQSIANSEQHMYNPEKCVGTAAVAFGKRTVSFKAKGEEVTSEVFPVEPCALIAETLPGCHNEVPAGNLRPSFVQKGD